MGDEADPIERARTNWLRNGLPDVDRVMAMASLVRANQIVEGRVEAVLKTFGLNTMSFNALRILSFSRQGRPMGRVAWGLMIHPATVTAVIDKLEASGLVARSADPADRRAVLASITPAGRAVADEATAALAGIEFGLDGLSDTEVRTLTDLLERLRRSAGDMARER